MTEDSIIRYSERMGHLPPYLFGMINKMKMDKRRKGLDVIDLGMGNPVDPAPDKVTEMLCKVAKDPKSHRYPVAGGIKHLKQELALMYDRDYGVSLDPGSEVITTIGSKEGVSHLCLALLGPGDTIMVPTPAFPVHIYAAIIAGANVMRFPMASDEDMLRQIADLCESMYPVPKMLMLNYPHNPTGQVTSVDFFKEVVKLAKKYRFMVIQDFAYSRITYDGYKAPSFFEVPGAKDVGVEFGSFSKSYNMAGWRMGYCVGNAEMIKGLEKIKGYYDYGIFTAIQAAGIVALRDCEANITEQVEVYLKRRDTMCDVLRRMDWEVDAPKAGMFLWVKIPERYKNSQDSMAFAMELMEKAHVAVAPGAGFSKEGEGYLRLALVENEERIRQALRQVRQADIELR
ncbi:aminotransferase class I/II-fold pyridoxal phosphate-dependent enzyme [Desulfoluna spongiiphila]|uniref:Aminotransferase n=1 Tax=Desulfoluna spongiiphila TaxID=419481 RepID=A0A1G5AQZ9_9BACT|nr:aminotransferase class I/II-fold pyridoxal phosphate-dependent enzyme [Desulfoluna spongiiphila]SCX80315.1 alanine-synthesizing transaminase [Desulfoluna spongiiphila]VVS91952.1 pyridoxal phosphate-dependent transferase [Desulfoluna spongiiphila]